MKVQAESSGPWGEPGDEYQARCTIKVDGMFVASVGNFSDCPEDANLGRDLGFVFGLPELLRKAHAAGVNGEPFEIETLENQD